MAQLDTMPTEDAIKLLARLWHEGRDKEADQILQSFRRHNPQWATERVEELARRLYHLGYPDYPRSPP